MQVVHKIVSSLAVAGLLASGTAVARDLLTKEQYIDYQAQMKCAEQQYSYSDPDRFEKEQQKIDKTFSVKEKDIEAGRMDELSEKYGADSAVLDAIDAKTTELCPQPL